MKTYNPQVLHLVPLGAVLAICLAAAGLSTARAEDTGNHGQFSASDYKFVTEAAQAGLLEVNLGQLATTKATEPAVRDFGQRMVKDHQKANQELTQLAMQKGAALPEGPSKKDDKMIEHLQGLSGVEFDRTYIRHMVADHKKVVKEFEKAAEKADDADLKNWVAKTLPTLQEHLSMAQSVAATINAVKPQASAQ
jgi:putative membrane protein